MRWRLRSSTATGLRLVAVLLLAVPSTAEIPTWRPAANPDPLRAASLPFEPAEAAAVGAEGWQVALQASYVNLWSRSWHTSAIHRETDRVGLPLTPAELRVLEQRYPGESLYFFDLEGWRSELIVSRGLASGVTLTARLPWVEFGQPHWDRVAERWHSAFGLPSGDRELFPRGGSLLYLDSADGAVERHGVAAAALGDLAVSASLPAGSWAGAEHRAVLALEAPTGTRDGLVGSGGWDAGLRWFSRWRWDAGEMKAGVGWTRLSREGSLLGLRRADPWHVFLGWDWRLRPGIIAYLHLSYERSLLADVAGGRVAEPSLFRRFGLAGNLTGRAWLAFDIGQDSQEIGASPDYSFHCVLGTSR